jgi:hypothetical protein
MLKGVSLMARKDKVLDILALAGLPEQAKLARLVRKWIGKAFSREQAKAIIKCYFDANGRLPELTQRLMDEKNRQEKIRNERKAHRAAAELFAVSPMKKYRADRVGESCARKHKRRRAMELAKRTFGQHVRDNFNADALALMSLIAAEDRTYNVRWVEAGFRPVRCALIEVRVTAAGKAPIISRYLLYRTNGRVLVARTGEKDLQAAWASQLPHDLVAVAATLKADGYSFKSDLEGQELIVFRPDGAEFKRVPWAGRTVDE